MQTLNTANFNTFLNLMTKSHNKLEFKQVIAEKFNTDKYHATVALNKVKNMSIKCTGVHQYSSFECM